MRNIFDQYTQPENRLTHALVSAMAEDPGLLRRFVKWVLGVNPPKHLKIVEQQLPGEYELSEPDYEQTGLPDAWIHDDGTWSLLIESKVAATLSLDQLTRHYRTAQKRGFEDVTVLAIDVLVPKKKLPEYVVFRTWREIYSWLTGESSNSQWATRVIRYMEVAERKWSTEGYFKEGTLTEFTGIPFDSENPYSYGEAKRLIRLMMDELRHHAGLKALIDARAEGRGGITGKREDGIWDYLRLRNLDSNKPHTKHPHFTLYIGEGFVSAILIFPNSIEPKFSKPIIQLEEPGFINVMAQVEKNMRTVVRKTPGAAPWVSVAQRHFTSRRSTAIKDGEITFDLRTAFDGIKGQQVKYQPQWLAAVYALISKKKSNMTFSVGVRFPYDSCKKASSAKILDSVAATWVACGPLLDQLPKK